MDSEVKEYADSLYEKIVTDSAETSRSQLSDFLALRAKRSGDLPFGGVDVQQVITIQVQYIERLMSGRVESYQNAFAEADRIPTEQDFTDILKAFQDEQRFAVKRSSAFVSRFLRARDAVQGGDSAQRLEQGSAHGHDRTLATWKIWKNRARLKRLTPREEQTQVPTRTTQEVSSTLALLHPELQAYGHYFEEHKLQEAVAAAFERYENRLNEIRDRSRKASVRAVSGHPLIYKLFEQKVLRKPYPRLGSSSSAKQALEQGLKGMFSGGISWIRNAYTHEKHKLPVPTVAEAVELLFVASYLMRMTDLAASRSKRSKGVSRLLNY